MAFRLPVLLSSLALALVLAACTPAREALVLDTHRISADRLIATVRSGEVPDASFSGDGSMAFDAPQMSGSVFMSVALRKPDSLRVNFEGPFGMAVGFLFANRDSFMLYNAMENWYIHEPVHGGGIRSVLPFDVTFTQLMDAFTGSFRLPVEGKPVRYLIDDDMFLLKFMQGHDTASYWIDPAVQAVARYRVSRGDSILVEATADSWTEENGRAMPRSITMTFPAASSSVSVFYSSIVMNPEKPSFSHAVPSRARRRVLQ